MNNKVLQANIEYSEMERFLRTAYMAMSMNPHVSLEQDRLVLERIVNSFNGSKGTLVNKIIDLNKFFGVPEEIQNLMHDLRQLGNLGAHDYIVFSAEAHRAGETLFKIIDWYCGYDPDQLSDKSRLFDAQYCLAMCYKEGIYTYPDNDAYLKWLKMAASNDNMYALRDLGQFIFGETKKDLYEQGLQYLDKAMKLGSLDAKCYLGMLYLGNYEGITHDEKRGYQYLSDCANAGDLYAEYALVSFFYGFNTHNEELQIDDSDMVRRFQNIVAKGKDDINLMGMVNQALIKLGDCYTYGDGVEIDLKEAFGYYNTAAKRKDVNAIFKVGTCYEKGRGVERDLNMAEKYYIEAAMMGHNGAAARANIIKLNRV